MEHAPHTDADVASMLDEIGKASLDELFAHIPDALRPDHDLELPGGLSEDEVVAHLAAHAARNRTDAVCFAGGGAYDHYVPAVVGALISRGELLTSYTPYQPEVSQGMLQALFEYQTAISELAGLPVANASLYDGGSAVAEAVSMACADARRDDVLVSQALDAPSRQIVATYATPIGRTVHVAPTDATTGTTPVGEVPEGTGAIVIAQPNALGIVEDVRAWAEAARSAGARLIVKLEPTAVGLLARPGEQGADIVVGEGQPLGQGLAYGGPSFGFLACSADQVRRIPGRIVGQTIDTRGTPGYVMTLRAREQDIRRERATSNICTNQTLCAVAGLIHLTWLGRDGLAELARICLSRAHHAAGVLGALDGVEVAPSGAFLKELCLRVDVDDPDALVAAVFDAGYLIGPVVPDGPFAGCVMVALTERRTAAQVEGLATALADAVAAVRPAVEVRG